MSLMRPNHRPSLDLSLQGAPAAPAAAMPEIASALSWRTWDAGCEEAQRRSLPILALAEASWANSSQRLAFHLQHNDTLRELVETRVVPVLVSPEERPDLVAAWRWAAMALTGTSGPPLLMFLTQEGLPFLAYCTMAIEGDDAYPSLVSLVESVAENYAADAPAIAVEAQQLDATGLAPFPDTPGETEWDAFRQRLDFRRGGLTEEPKHPRPTLLWTLLDCHARGNLPDDILAWLSKTLDELVRGGTWDQIDRGFHRCARDDRWIVPHFEKPIPLNAQLAAVYARAATELQNDAFRDIASRLISFCTVALREGVDVIASDTGYYTWTSKELLNTLDAALVQVVTLHYDIKPVHERQALRRVIEMEQMDRFSHEDVDVLQTRLVRGRAQLRAARQRRPAPPALSNPSLAWRAETVRWLLKACDWSDAVRPAVLVSELTRLVEGRLDPVQGYARRSRNMSDQGFCLEDQAALLATFVEAHRVTGEQPWLDRSRELADILLALWWTDEGWLDGQGTSSRSRAVIDDILPSSLANLSGALQDLGRISDRPAYSDQVARVRQVERTLAARSGHWSALIPIHP